MHILGIDVGSSSVKAALLKGGAAAGRRVSAGKTVVRAAFPTTYAGVRVEVDPASVLKAVAAAVRQLGPAARKVDAVALSVMAPSWVAMDKAGKALTPIITHQDRRSVEIARQIEERVGKERHLQLAGNRPFPGGISSTTFAWYVQNEPALMRKVELVGHLNTYLHRQITGGRVVDPSNASFMGVYRTTDLGGWSEELCEAVGVRPALLPDVLEADVIGGGVRPEAARCFGLTAGTPVLVGLMDTGSAMLLTGAKPGQLVNVCGTTDVLILCTDQARPDEKVLTRALGVGRRWTAVCTIAAAGASLVWAKEVLFSDLSVKQFRSLIKRLAASPLDSGVRFDPYLAGERTSIEQRQGAFTGLTLSTKRDELLGAIVESLAAASAARLPLLAMNGVKMKHGVMLSGGAQGGLDQILHRDWPGRWTFQVEEEATLRGLATLTPRER